jgi:hypothetical protein
MSLLEALPPDSTGIRWPGGSVVVDGAVVDAAVVEGPVSVAGAAVGSPPARWLPTQPAKASTAATVKAASPRIRGVLLILRSLPVASAPDLFSTVDLSPLRSLTAGQGHAEGTG